MPPTNGNEEVQPLTTSTALNEKYAAKAPTDCRKPVTIAICLVVGVLYLTSHHSSASSATTDKPSVYHELHQSIHNVTEIRGKSKASTTPNTTVQEPKPKATAPTKSPKVTATTATTTTTSTPLNVNELIKTLAAARSQMEAKLRVQYGTFFDAIFLDSAKVSRGRALFTSGDPSSTTSWMRFRRKLMIKLLTVHTTNQQKPVPFVWATGGHSSTAGHGNFYHESYTSYLAQAAGPVLNSLQLKLDARNYAMGGTAAAPEVALCSKEIFGQDVDVLVWDYGMTDGNAIWKQSLYHLRGAMIPTRPIHLVYHAGGRSFGKRMAAATEMQDTFGVATLISSEAVMDAALAAIPDSFGQSLDDLKSMPDYVRNFRCGVQIEVGDPYCKAEKYNLTDCAWRKYQANWHPGWKWHALMGYLAGFTLVEVLDDAVQELATQSESPAALLKALQAEEDADYATFAKAATPSYFQDVLPPNGEDGFDLDRFVRGDNYCHTARLPAEIRHKGILTESTKTGFSTYDTGMGLAQAQKGALGGETMQLVYTDADRQNCPIPTNMDYKDYFYVSNSNAESPLWKMLRIPNNAEAKEYPIGKPLHGHVTICFTLCPWGKCPNGVLDAKAFPDKLEIEINGKAVTQLRDFQECVILQHDGGFQWTANADGRFEVRVRVKKEAPPGSYVRLSAIIVS